MFGLGNSQTRCEGDYLSTRRAQGGLEGFVSLVAGAVHVSVTPDGRLLTTRSGEARAWVAEGPLDEGRFISVQGYDRMVFRMSEGRAASFRPSSNIETLERAGFWRRPQTLATLAGLTAAAALATLAGLGLRNRREVRQNQVQARAGLVQNTQAGLWLTAIGLFALWSGSVLQWFASGAATSSCGAVRPVARFPTIARSKPAHSQASSDRQASQSRSSPPNSERTSPNHALQRTATHVTLAAPRRARRAAIAPCSAVSELGVVSRF